MKKFLIRLSIFVIPFAIFFVLVEHYCANQSTFAIKRHYVENEKGRNEILILGSSHLQNALNPEFFAQNTTNLAFAGQTVEINYYLMEKYINEMPKLKMVIFEASPHSIYMKFDPEEGNGHIYANLYDIYYKVSPYSVKNYSCLLTNFKFFSGIYLDYINPLETKYIINKYGFVTNDYYDRFFKLNYNTKKIEESFVMNHGFDSKDLLVINKLYMDKAVALCKKKGVKMILLTPPFYVTYERGIPADAKKDMQKIVNKGIKYSGLQYYDFSNDRNFSVKDFKNDNHLNSDGAKKFSIKIDSLITHHK
jgi:hypothetical protein